MYYFCIEKKGQIINALESIKEEKEYRKEILSEIINLYYNGV